MEMNNKYPKVLIIGQGFNKKFGGGITLSNLFKDWPKDKIASLVLEEYYDLKNEICDNILVLDFWKYPINKYKKPLEIINNETFINNISNPKISNSKNKTKIILSKIKRKLPQSGLLPYFCKSKLSKKEIYWIKEFEPDIIYTQLGSINVSKIVKQVNKEFAKPIVIHIMDDWPKKIYTYGVFSFFNRIRINKIFPQLVNKASLLIGISDLMCEEYKKRYNSDFITFHNPIDIENWLNYQKNDLSIKNIFNIYYLGRVGLSNENSILDTIKTVINIKIKSIEVFFHIYTFDSNNKDINSFKNNNINIYPSISNKEVPKLLYNADLLILPLDFDKISVDFAKFSMPTKASEYMISGVPILLYAPDGHAVIEDAKKSKWAYIVDERNLDKLKEGIIELIENQKLREKIAKQAIKIAKEKYDSKIVREKFREELLEASNI